MQCIGAMRFILQMFFCLVQFVVAVKTIPVFSCCSKDDIKAIRAGLLLVLYIKLTCSYDTVIYSVNGNPSGFVQPFFVLWPLTHCGDGDSWGAAGRATLYRMTQTEYTLHTQQSIM